MRILVITQFFSPDITAAAFRMSETVDILLRRGCEVRVVTSYPHKSNDPVVDPKHAIAEDLVKRVKLSPVGNGGLFSYLRHYLSFMVGAFAKGVGLWSGRWCPDVIWVTSPPLFSGLAGMLLGRLLRCPIVLDIRDLWPDSAVSAGQLSYGGRAYRVGQRLESLLYRRADAITCVSAPMAEYLKARASCSVTVVYNGVQGNEISNQRPAAAPYPRICYAGNLGRVQGLEMLLTSFAGLCKDPKYDGWKITFIGSGANKKALKQCIEAMPELSQRVDLLPPMSKSSVARYLRESSILFLNLKADKVFSLTIPSKLFDYMLAGRPILGGITGQGKDILMETGGNIAFEPSNTSSFSAALYEMLGDLPVFSSKANQNASFVSEHFRREEQTDRLLKVFRDTLDQTR